MNPAVHANNNNNKNKTKNTTACMQVRLNDQRKSPCKRMHAFISNKQTHEIENLRSNPATSVHATGFIKKTRPDQHV